MAAQGGMGHVGHRGDNCYQVVLNITTRFKCSGTHFVTLLHLLNKYVCSGRISFRLGTKFHEVCLRYPILYVHWYHFNHTPLAILHEMVCSGQVRCLNDPNWWRRHVEKLLIIFRIKIKTFVVYSEHYLFSNQCPECILHPPLLAPEIWRDNPGHGRDLPPWSTCPQRRHTWEYHLNSHHLPFPVHLPCIIPYTLKWCSICFT